MAMTTNEVTDLFKNLEERKTLLIKCTDLYKTLDSHYTSLLKSLNSKSKKLDSALQYLDSPHQISLDNLNNRENSIPSRFSSLSSEIESKKASAIAELRKPLDLSLPTIEVLKSLCRRMDCSRLMKFLIERRKDKKSLKDEMEEAMKECVDPAKMVLEAVKDFVDAKETAKRQVVDKRWACGMVVSGLFSPEKLMEREKGMEAAFAKKTVAEAEKLLREWKEKGEQVRDGDGEGGEGDEEESEGKMGSAETAMFFQVVIGFGLKEIFEDDFYVKAGIEFSTRRDMAKLAIPLFGDKLPDFIDKLIKNGKEVEAVYFAVESSLTERFQPAILLKSFLRNCKKNTTELLMKGNHNAEATEEAKRYETNYIRAIVRCVVDYNLESVFPIDNLKKRLTVLEKEKADKKASAANSKPFNKRAHSSGADRSNGAPPLRPSKRSKYPSHGRREISQPLSPVSRYMGPYSYSNPTAYNPGAPAVTYAPRFGAPHVATANQITQQQYVLPSGSTPSQLISAYGMHDPIDTVSTTPQVVNYYGGVAADPNAVPQLNSPYVLPDGSAANPSAIAQHGGTYVVPGGNVPASAEAAPGSSYGVQNVYGAYDYGATSTSYRPPYAQ